MASSLLRSVRHRSPFGRPLCLALALATMGTLAACSSTDVSVSAPSAAKCQVSVNAASVSVAAAGGTGALAVTTTRDCTWDASSAAPWVALSSTNGQGSGEVTYRVGANTDPATRRGTLSINDTQVAISQEGTPCRFTVSPTSAAIGPEGGAIAFRVETSSAACAWTASSSDGWLHAGAASQSGSGTVQLTVDANAGAAQAGRIVVAGVTIPIEQAASPTVPGVPGPSPTPTPPRGTCSVSVSPLQVSVAALGGAGTVSVSTVATCPWTAESDSTWLVLAGPAAGSGSATLAYTVLPSLLLSPRSGILTVAGQAVVVTQAAVLSLPPACTFAINPASATIGAAPTTLSVNVTTQAGCAWTEQPNDSWIEPGSPSSGTGSGTANVVIQRYKDSSERTGTMTIAGKTFTVTQSK